MIKKKMIARLLAIYSLEKNVDLFSWGSATFRREATARGLEPDESYCIDERKELPDLAIEVVITSGGNDKLEVYKGLNISEVWFWHNCQQMCSWQFSLHWLCQNRSGYHPVSRSEFFPKLDLNFLATYINPLEKPQS